MEDLEMGVEAGAAGQAAAGAVGESAALGGNGAAGAGQVDGTGEAAGLAGGPDVSLAAEAGRDAAELDGAGAGPDAPDLAWSAALPEELRELAGRAGSLEDLAQALERGLNHLPLAAGDSLELDLPELFQEDAAPGELDWFRDLAAQQGLSKAQAEALANGFYSQVSQGLEAQRAATAQELRAEFGAGYESKLALAGDLARRIDELSGGSFGKVLQRGLGNDPDFIRAMAAIGESVSESAWPGGRSDGGEAAMSTEEFISQIFSGCKATGRFSAADGHWQIFSGR